MTQAQEISQDTCCFVAERSRFTAFLYGCAWVSDALKSSLSSTRTATFWRHTQDQQTESEMSQSREIFKPDCLLRRDPKRVGRFCGSYRNG